MKKFNKNDIIFLLATKLSWLVILLWSKTARIRIVGKQHWRRVRESGKGVLIIIWHGRILLPIFAHRGEGITAMVSRHRDGEMIALTLQRLGYKTIRGSSTRGGAEAFHEMLTVLKRGKVCAIMPDGPQGPRHKFKAGALYLAQRSDAYLLPLTFSSSKRIQFNSWDRFALWWPFSKCVVMYGKPERLSKDMSISEMVDMRKRIQKRMIELELKADMYFIKKSTNASNSKIDAGRTITENF